MKKKVKFVTSISGLADPDREALDRQYAKMLEQAKDAAVKANREFKPGPVMLAIAERKKADRYDDVQRGFKRDFSFRPGDEALIPAAIAEAWQEQEICLIVEESSKKAA
jgi:hypothetical protein